MLPKNLTEEMVDAACVAFAENGWIPWLESPETWDMLDERCSKCLRPHPLNESDKLDRLETIADTRHTVRVALLAALDAVGEDEDDSRVASGV